MGDNTRKTLEDHIKRSGEIEDAALKVAKCFRVVNQEHDKVMEKHGEDLYYTGLFMNTQRAIAHLIEALGREEENDAGTL